MPMRSSAMLADQQREFLAALAAADARVPMGIRTGGAPTLERVEAYRRNVAASWRGALANAYPVIVRLVGEAFFAEAAARYARAHPSTSGDLHRFGAAFAAFLEAYPHARSLEYLPDMARLEWAVHRAYLAAEAAPFDLQALATVPADAHENLRFQLHPAAGLIASRHPILAIWEANQRDRDGTPDSFEGSDFLLVMRGAVEGLDEVRWRFLDALAAGETLGAAARHFAAGREGELAPALRDFVARGTIAGFTA